MAPIVRSVRHGDDIGIFYRFQLRHACGKMITANAAVIEIGIQQKRQALDVGQRGMGGERTVGDRVAKRKQTMLSVMRREGRAVIQAQLFQGDTLAPREINFHKVLALGQRGAKVGRFLVFFSKMCDQNTVLANVKSDADAAKIRPQVGRERKASARDSDLLRSRVVSVREVCGNEDGYDSLDNGLAVSKWDFSEKATESVVLSEASFLPAECDCKLRDTWFYDNNEDSIKSLEELFGMYEQSVGIGSNFLLNVGPDNRGRINERDAERVRELGCRIKAAYGNQLDFGEVQRAEDGSYSIATEGFDPKGYAQRAKARLVNTVVIEEDLREGQGVREFKLYAHLPAYNFKRILIFNGSTVGHKLICRFPTVNTPMLTAEIIRADGTVAIKKISAYLVK